jgi:hypothetical protein
MLEDLFYQLMEINAPEYQSLKKLQGSFQKNKKPPMILIK